MSAAPFETPVVPPVYSRVPQSSRSIFTAGGDGAVERIRSCIRWTPGVGATRLTMGGSWRANFRRASQPSGKRMESGIEQMT